MLHHKLAYCFSPSVHTVYVRMYYHVFAHTVFWHCVTGRLLRVLMELVTMGDSQVDNGEDCSVICER